MIISDSSSFAFVHIPKCAGTSVRTVLLAYDDRAHIYVEGYANASGLPEVFDVEGFGPVKHNHLSLSAMRNVLPQELARIQEYRSLAIIRDPVPRFISCVSERVKHVEGRAISQVSKERIRKEIGLTIEELAKRDADPATLWPLDLVTFQPQVSFVFLDGSCELSKIYRLDEMQDFYDDAARHLGHDFEPATVSATSANRTEVIRNPALRAIDRKVPILRDTARRLLPQQFRSRIAAPFKQGSGASLSWILEEPGVGAFISEYYADDIALWRYSADRSVERGLLLREVTDSGPHM